MKKIAFLILVAMMTILTSLAIPAHRGLVQMPQPDGTLLTINLVGDEFYHFNTTADGYTVLLNEAGAYVYAQREGKTLVETGILAHDEGHRTAQELALLAGTPKRLTDETQVAQAHVRRAKRDVDLSNFDLEHFRGLVILIEFSDVQFAAENPQEFYTNMFSTEGLTGFHDPRTDRDVSCPGSVRDYFDDQSNGAFTPPFDVYGPYSTTYKSTQCNHYSTSIFKQALKDANNEVDYTQYDNNNDGRVDMVYFLVAGYSSSYGGNNSGYLWPHASNLYYSYLSLDGKWIDRYASSTELYGWESSPSTVVVEGIGTVAHEFSHVLGLPDFYDTDYAESGGESHHPGGWDVMAGGGDYNYGRCPAGYTLYERYALGWANPKTINKEGQYSLEAVNISRDGYLLRTPRTGEFFTIENRQKTGWDSYIPGHGMIVTRVDSTNTSVWANNKINCNPNHNYFEMLRAGNTTEGDLASDPFPGTKGIAMITNETLPNLKTWNGQDNYYNLVGIAERAGVVTFNVVKDGSLDVLIEDFESMPATTSTTDSNVEGDFTYWTFNKSGVRAPGEDKADGYNSVMMKLPSNFYSLTPVYYNFYMASLKVFNTSSTAAKYALEYSTDGGQTWFKALSAAGGDAAEVVAKTTGQCYWSLNLKNNQPAQFRISQVGGNKNTATYVDNFSLYYTGDEGGPDMYVPGDVNGDGDVNIGDINALISIILGGEDNTSGRSDVNGDGDVNIGDINAVIALILN